MCKQGFIQILLLFCYFNSQRIDLEYFIDLSILHQIFCLRNYKSYRNDEEGKNMNKTIIRNELKNRKFFYGKYENLNSISTYNSILI